MTGLTTNLPSMLRNLDYGIRLGDSRAAASSIAQTKGVDTNDAVTASTTQTQAGGTKIYGGFTNVSSASSSDAITFPVALPGQWMVVVNSSGQTIQAFPAKGDKINAAAKDAAVTIATATTSVFIVTATLQWWGGAITNEA